ncbi:MAG: phosphoribosylformylglycinamidine synthase subunit PurL [Candidatus Wallbacteria bacterium]|nr:phosphoribosylformylglycinamidine synthase subunit PurL [Candidatus Wallbacteria bacterium]
MRTCQEVELMNLKMDEYNEIVRRLGREPNDVELGVFSVMWSEHCSYKSSKALLKTLPVTGPAVLQGPGENAGIVDLGDGQNALAFKIESHNHPSYVEPYQGAATGVGGILRDVFTMGARPVAILDSLHFGSPDHNQKNAYLFERVVAGISWYGNCMGVPTVGGETKFDDIYSRNPLVNAFTAGLVKKDRIRRGLASGAGNPVIYVGSKTGRDGIHGATFASDRLDENSDNDRPAVQVGDPFSEKLLLEACLELFETDYVIGIQDMGAAGLTSSSTEMASRSGTGIRMNLDLVPQREENMSAYEIMLSESQERMLLVARKGTEDAVRVIFEKWDLNFAVIGEVIADEELIVMHHGQVAARFPLTALEPPVYQRPVTPRPARIFSLPPESLKSDPLVQFSEMIALSPCLRYAGQVFHKYDFQVGTDTVIGPGADAAVLRIKGSSSAVALNLESQARLCYINPFEGIRAVIAEAVINQACVNAYPLGLTNCLNFGSPEKPEVMWEFSEVIRGMRESCLFFDIPVTGGNVSFYNDFGDSSIHPTPVIGLAGLVQGSIRQAEIVPASIFLAGELCENLAGSVYLRHFHQTPGGDFSIDLEAVKRLQALVLDCHKNGFIHAAHDISDGGIIYSLLEWIALCNGLGIEINDQQAFSSTGVVFSELPGRVLLLVKNEATARFISSAKDQGLPVRRIGSIVKNPVFKINGIDLDLENLLGHYFKASPELRCFTVK